MTKPKQVQKKLSEHTGKTFSVIMPSFTCRGWAYLRKLLYIQYSPISLKSAKKWHMEIHRERWIGQLWKQNKSAWRPKYICSPISTYIEPLGNIFACILAIGRISGKQMAIEEYSAHGHKKRRLTQTASWLWSHTFTSFYVVIQRKRGEAVDYQPIAITDLIF